MAYADDLVIQTGSKAEAAAIIKEFAKFKETWGLEINPKKSEILRFETDGETKQTQEPEEIEGI